MGWKLSATILSYRPIFPNATAWSPKSRRCMGGLGLREK
jgi:hypothetical protein